MPTSVVTGEGMEFVNDDGSDVLEELPMVDLGRHQNRFEGFRRREQAIGWIGKDVLPDRPVLCPHASRLLGVQLIQNIFAAVALGCSTRPESD